MAIACAILLGLHYDMGWWTVALAMMVWGIMPAPNTDE